MSKKNVLVGKWRHTTLIPALVRQRKADLCEFEDSMIYKELDTGQVPKVQRDPVSEEKEEGEGVGRGG